MLKNKRIIIFLALLILAGIVILIYFLWFKKEIQTQKEEKPVEKIFDQKAKDIKYLARENKIRFLSPESLTIEELDLNSKQVNELSKIPLSLTQKLIWSPDGNKIILKVLNNRTLLSQQGYLLDDKVDDGVITNWLFDLKTENLVELPLEIKGVDWLNNDKIIYYYSKSLEDSDLNPGQINSSLSKSDPDGSNFQKIMDLNANQFYGSSVVLSPDKKEVMLSPEIEGVGKNSIYLINLDSKNIKNITEGGLTIGGSWSTTGKNIFLFQYLEQTNDNNPESGLWYANFEGVDKKKINLEILYGLAVTSPDDNFIYTVSAGNNQSVYQINSGSLEKKIIAGSSQNKDLINISEIGLLNNDLYVVANEYLYKIKI